MCKRKEIIHVEKKKTGSTVKEGWIGEDSGKLRD